MCDRVGARRSHQIDNEQKQQKEKKRKKKGGKERNERNARFILRIQLNDNQIRLIWEMVRVAVPKVPRIRASQGAVGQF